MNVPAITKLSYMILLIHVLSLATSSKLFIQHLAPLLSVMSLKQTSILGRHAIVTYVSKLRKRSLRYIVQNFDTAHKSITISVMWYSQVLHMVVVVRRIDGPGGAVTSSNAPMVAYVRVRWIDLC
jgi:hypothetical protein